MLKQSFRGRDCVDDDGDIDILDDDDDDDDDDTFLRQKPASRI